MINQKFKYISNNLTKGFSDAGESDDKEKNFLDGLMEPLKSQVMRCLVNENDLKIEEEIGAGAFLTFKTFFSLFKKNFTF